MTNYECPKCHRTSTIVNLNEECPFCDHTSPSQPTTDSVMREKFDKESQLVCDWWEHHGRKVKDVSDLEDLIGSIHTFNSHSLAEARREWVEEMRGKVEEKINEAVAVLSTEFPPRFEAGGGLVGKPVPQRKIHLQTTISTLSHVLNLLTGDTPERKV